VLAAGAVLGASCGGNDDCGPDGAPSAGLIASGDQVSLSFGQLSAGLNNDCPASDAPAGVTSLTIHGTQTNNPGGFLTLCVARPDLLAHHPQALGLDVAGSQVHLVDVTGTATNCTFAIDRARPPTGTASASGLCDNGGDPAGFALVIDGALGLTRTCGANVDSVAVTLRGRVAVAAD
jgi:hypothetical protein